ncbi:MAG: flagellin [Planctomycetota bacterium]
MSGSIQGGASARGYSQRLQEQLQALQDRTRARLASGRRIATAADDAAGLAISKRLEAEVRSSRQAERNAADVQSVARVADGAMQSSQDSLGRMRELTVQAQNGTLSASDRETIQQEFDQLSAQLNQTAGGTRFGDTTLLDGSASGEAAIAAATGDSDSVELEISDVGADALGLSGRSVADASTLTALDQAGEMLASERARIGATDNTLGRQQNRLAAARESAEAARSRIEDVDVAREVAESTRGRILSELSLAGQRVSEQGRARIYDLLS